MRTLTFLIAQMRRLTYWLGFDPKLGTILHSPSRSLQNQFAAWHRNFLEGFEAGIAAQISADTEKARAAFPREVGPLLQSAGQYPRDPEALRRRLRSEVDALYGPDPQERWVSPLPTIPDGTRGPQGYWRGGHFWFNCSLLPILPTLRDDALQTNYSVPVETIHAGQMFTGRALSGHVIVILPANDALAWSWFSEHAFPRLSPGTTVEFRIETPHLHDHQSRCCTEHNTHTMPHRGCILR